MNEKYHLSDYAKRFDKNGNTALFNGLNLKKAYGKTEIINRAITSLDNSLIKNNFLVKPGQDEARIRELRSQIGSINISNIVMIVDNRCNYACSYCQIEENMDSKQKSYAMSKETAKKALDLFEKNTKNENEKTINITGGEPLMNIRTVKYIIKRSNKMPNSRRVIFTNGSLVTSKLADYFSKTDTLMLVSLDGPKEIHDSVRIKKSGQGTYDISLRGYKLLKDAGCKVGISSVTGIHNVNKMREVSDLFASLEPPSIGLNFGHYLLDKENPTAIKMGKFAKILTNFYETMRNKNIFVENISRFITPFYEENPRLNECQAQGRGFSVDSRGKIGTCKSLLVSDIISKPLEEINQDLSKEPMFQEWAKRSPFTLEECVDCNVIGICGGGCTYDSFAINKGDINKIDSRLCEYTNEVLKFLIWDLFEDIKHKIKDIVYIPNLKEQEEKFLKYYDPSNQLQRSVGHEKDK